MEALIIKIRQKKLVELVQVLGCNSFPFMLGGDFNIIRHAFESNKGIRHSKWSNLFNGIIEHWALQELDLSGRSFTWSNNQEDPLFEKLDRILVSSGWISTYPLATVIALNRRVSDHTGLLVTYGLSAVQIHRPFKFELSWFLHQDLHAIVTSVWNAKIPGMKFIDKWQNRAREMRKVLKGWHINIRGTSKKIKEDLDMKIDAIDRQSELHGMTFDLRHAKSQLEKQIDILGKEEELIWFQRFKEKDLMEGDSCTAYFMARASNRRRKLGSFIYIRKKGTLLETRIFCIMLLIFINNFLVLVILLILPCEFL